MSEVTRQHRLFTVKMALMVTSCIIEVTCRSEWSRFLDRKISAHIWIVNEEIWEQDEGEVDNKISAYKQQ